MSAPDDAVGRLAPVVRVAPAKLNLTLAIVGRRADGFHDLHSIMVPLGLGDRLALAPALGPRDQLHVTGPAGGPAPDLGPPERNLVLRAIAAGRRAVRDCGLDNPTPALAARLEKRIPAAAGLAGGSSDAAAALDGALEAWGIRSAIPDAAVAAAAAGVGSDVPFFLAGGWALVEGRGERVTPLRAPVGDPPAVLLVTPALPVVTREAFAAYAGGIRAGGAAALASSVHLAGELAGGLAVGRLHERAGILSVANDLVPAAAALVPALVPFRRALARLVERPVGQSGSGPTLWVLYPSLVAAARVEATVRRSLEEGRLSAPGDAPPFIAATGILASSTVPANGT